MSDQAGSELVSGKTDVALILSQRSEPSPHYHAAGDTSISKYHTPGDRVSQAEALRFDKIPKLHKASRNNVIDPWEHATLFMMGFGRCKMTQNGLPPQGNLYGTQRERLEAFWLTFIADNEGNGSYWMPLDPRYTEWLRSVPEGWVPHRIRTATQYPEMVWEFKMQSITLRHIFAEFLERTKQTIPGGFV